MNSMLSGLICYINSLCWNNISWQSFWNRASNNFPVRWKELCSITIEMIGKFWAPANENRELASPGWERRCYESIKMKFKYFKAELNFRQSESMKIAFGILFIFDEWKLRILTRLSRSYNFPNRLDVLILISSDSFLP